MSAPRTLFTLRQGSRQLRPSALFSFCPQKPGTQNAPHVFASLFRAQWLEPSPTASLSPYASQSFGIGCSFGFGRSMPSASSSLASFSISYACAYFVHNLYTKTKTATNRVSNLHPRCLYAGNISNIQKMQRPMMMQTRSFPICCRELSYYSPSLYSPLFFCQSLYFTKVRLSIFRDLFVFMSLVLPLIFCDFGKSEHFRGARLGVYIVED